MHVQLLFVAVAAVVRVLVVRVVYGNRANLSFRYEHEVPVLLIGTKSTRYHNKLNL